MQTGQGWGAGGGGNQGPLLSKVGAAEPILPCPSGPGDLTPPFEAFLARVFGEGWTVCPQNQGQQGPKADPGHGVGPVWQGLGQGPAHMGRFAQTQCPQHPYTTIGPSAEASTLVQAANWGHPPGLLP